MDGLETLPAVRVWYDIAQDAFWLISLDGKHKVQLPSDIRLDDHKAPLI